MGDKAADKNNGELLKRLRGEWMGEGGGRLITLLFSEEEANRKGGKAEVAVSTQPKRSSNCSSFQLAANMKKGGEAQLMGAAAKKGQKAGTAFPIPKGAEIVCKSTDR